MENTFKIEIISPEKKIFYEENVYETVLPAYEGEMGILKDHISIISFLKPGILKILKSSENIKSFFVEEGIIEFYQNCLTVLSSKIIDIQSLKNEKINELISEAETKLKDEKLDDNQRYLAHHKAEVLRNINLN